MGEVVWIDKPPEFRLDGDGVEVALFSGDKRLGLRLSRAMFRSAVESGKRLLDEADLRDQYGRVLPFGRSG